MSLFRYYRDQQDADGDKLWWPGGADGFPFRGNSPPQTTRKEFENLQLAHKFRCRTFYLAKEEDYKAYMDIRERCANGLYTPVDRDRQWDEDSKDYRVYLEWIESAYETMPPTGAFKNVPTDTNSTTVPYGRLAGLQPSGFGW